MLFLDGLGKLGKFIWLQVDGECRANIFNLLGCERAKGKNVDGLTYIQEYEKRGRILALSRHYAQYAIVSNDLVNCRVGGYVMLPSNMFIDSRTLQRRIITR